MSIRVAAAFASCVIAAGVAAQSATFLESGDPKRGQPLVERDCNGCHVRLVGDADRIYTRDDRRVRTPAQLQAQVAYCNTQLATGYFPDDETHVAAWLNQRYYRFAR